jgi:hypothetical protein
MKEQETRLTLRELDDDDDNICYAYNETLQFTTQNEQNQSWRKSECFF